MKHHGIMFQTLAVWGICLTFWLTAAVSAEPFTPIALNATDDFSDLQQFGAAIKDKRILYLDELTHGEHEVFALKARLVKYLHQEHNFGVLLLESGMFDVNEAVKAASQQPAQRLAALAPGNIFFSYAKDPAFLGLMDYIDSRRQSAKPLALVGFDGRLSGSYAVGQFVPQLKQQLSSLADADVLLADWPQFARQLQATLERKFVALTAQQVHQHIQHSYRLIDALNAADSSLGLDSPAYYARLLEGLVRLFEVNYQLRRFDEHDLVMANNIHWLLQQVYPQQKVIVWGHYVHVNRQGYIPFRAHNVTSALAQAYAKQSYIVNFAGLSGQYREYIDGSVKNLPALHDSQLAFALQHKFTAPAQALFLEPSQFTQPGYRHLMLSGFEYRPEFQIPLTQWRNHFDAVFLINQVSPSP